MNLSAVRACACVPMPRWTDFTRQAGAVAKYLSTASGLPPKGTYPTNGRATPDVAALGEGYQVVNNGAVESVGGTSASAPLFAGLVSLLNEARSQKGGKPMGFINPWLYNHTDVFTDVIKGTSKIGRDGEALKYGFNCEVGWDPVTGKPGTNSCNMAPSRQQYAVQLVQQGATGGLSLAGLGGIVTVVLLS